MQWKSSAPLVAVLFLMASLSNCFGEAGLPMSADEEIVESTYTYA